MGRRDQAKAVDSPQGELRNGLGFTDEERRDAMLLGAEGNRLTYRRTAQFHGAAHQGAALRALAKEALRTEIEHLGTQARLTRIAELVLSRD